MTLPIELRKGGSGDDYDLWNTSSRSAAEGQRLVRSHDQPVARSRSGRYLPFACRTGRASQFFAKFWSENAELHMEVIRRTSAAIERLNHETPASSSKEGASERVSRKKRAAAPS